MPAISRAGLRNGALLMHLGLAAAITATLLAAVPGPGLRWLLLGIALLPLAFTLPGLLACRVTALRWLALALVFYTGIGSMEAIAAGSLAAAGLLLFALVELALVLILLRHPLPPAPRE